MFLTPRSGGNIDLAGRVFVVGLHSSLNNGACRIACVMLQWIGPLVVVVMTVQNEVDSVLIKERVEVFLYTGLCFMFAR